jgi:hypothetical protein
VVEQPPRDGGVGQVGLHAGGDAAELGLGGVEVVHDQVQALVGAGRVSTMPTPMQIEQSDPGGVIWDDWQQFRA